MKLMRNITLVTALAVLLVAGGCKTESRTEATPAEIARIELMQKVPVFYEDYDFWDIRTLRSDADLSDLYQVWYDRKVKFLEERYGIDSTGIEYLAQGEGGMLDIIVTQYDIEALRDRIAADFKRDTAYPDTEVWKSEPSPDPQSATGGWVLADSLRLDCFSQFGYVGVEFKHALYFIGFVSIKQAIRGSFFPAPLYTYPFCLGLELPIPIL